MTSFTLISPKHLLIGCIVFVFLAECATCISLNLKLHFPEAGLDSNYEEVTQDPTLFGVNFITCFNAQEYNHTSCPGGEGVFSEYLLITQDHFIGNDTWQISIPIGNEYIGPLYIDVYAPQAFAPSNEGLYASTVKACTQKEVYEMGGEMCQQQGNAWTLQVDDGSADLNLDIYPAFGVSTGDTYVLLRELYSPQLNNSRNVSAYVPSTISQNTVKRPVNIMILLDGSTSIVNTFAKRGGFETGQADGSVPESILIGITDLEFALAGNLEQRTYEFTYAEQIDVSLSCPQGTGPTGGSDKLLEWIDEIVIPKAVEALGMQRGEVTIAGGSLGGLASCYAATKNPAVFERALCMSLTNCFNFGTGGLAPVIAANYEASGKAPKSVVQFMGAEGVVATWGTSNQTQFDFMVNDELAWRSIGLVPMTSAANLSTQMWPGASFGYTSELPAPEHAVMSVILPGGQHAQTTWEREFAIALPYLYRPNSTDPYRIPVSETLRYISPTIG